MHKQACVCFVHSTHLTSGNKLKKGHFRHATSDFCNLKSVLKNCVVFLFAFFIIF